MLTAYSIIGIIYFFGLLYLKARFSSKIDAGDVALSVVFGIFWPVLFSTTLAYIFCVRVAIIFNKYVKQKDQS